MARSPLLKPTVPFFLKIIAPTTYRTAQPMGKHRNRTEQNRKAQDRTGQDRAEQSRAELKKRVEQHSIEQRLAAKEASIEAFQGSQSSSLGGVSEWLAERLAAWYRSKVPGHPPGWEWPEWPAEASIG